MKIQVVKLPEGFAPEWVRQNFQGLTLDVETDITIKYGHAVTLEECLRKLELANRHEAASWWTKNTSCPLYAVMVFEEDDCLVIH